MASTPQTMLFYDQLPLALVARSRRQAIAFALASYAAPALSVALYGMAAMDRMLLFARHAPIILFCYYLPCLVVVLMRPNEGNIPRWLERVAIHLPAWFRGRASTGYKLEPEYTFGRRVPRGHSCRDPRIQASTYATPPAREQSRAMSADSARMRDMRAPMRVKQDAPSCSGASRQKANARSGVSVKSISKSTPPPRQSASCAPAVPHIEITRSMFQLNQPRLCLPIPL